MNMVRGARGPEQAFSHPSPHAMRQVLRFPRSFSPPWPTVDQVSACAMVDRKHPIGCHMSPYTRNPMPNAERRTKTWIVPRTWQPILVKPSLNEWVGGNTAPCVCVCVCVYSYLCRAFPHPCSAAPNAKLSIVRPLRQASTTEWIGTSQGEGGSLVGTTTTTIQHVRICRISTSS